MFRVDWTAWDKIRKRMASLRCVFFGGSSKMSYFHMILKFYFNYYLDAIRLFTNALGIVNPLPHMSHTYGRSPVCVLHVLKRKANTFLWLKYKWNDLLFFSTFWITSSDHSVHAWSQMIFYIRIRYIWTASYYCGASNAISDLIWQRIPVRISSINMAAFGVSLEVYLRDPTSYVLSFESVYHTLQ